MIIQCKLISLLSSEMFNIHKTSCGSITHNDLFKNTLAIALFKEQPHGSLVDQSIFDRIL